MASFGYRVIEPTGVAATDTAAWQAALLAGTPIWLANGGQPLRLNASTNLNDRSLIIEGNGTRIEQTANIGPVNLQFGLGTAYTIASVADESHTYVAPGAAGTAATPGLVTKLTMTTPAQAGLLVPEQLYKLASDNVSPQAAASENGRMGEVVRVRAVNATTGEVWLHAPVWRSDLYTTGARISRMNGQDHRVRIKDVEFWGDDAGIAGNWTQPMIWLQGAVVPHVDVAIERAFSTGIVSLGNYLADVKAKIRRVHHDINNGQIGYGIFVSADMLGRYTGQGSRMRHFAATNWTDGTTGTDIRHGASIGTTFHDMTAEYCEGAGIDTHSDAVDCLITGCLSRRCFNGEGGLGAGFQLRGYRNVLEGCRSDECEVGVQVFENTDDGNDRCVVKDFVSNDKGAAVLLTGRSTSATQMRADIIGGVFSPGTGAAISASRATATVLDTLIRPRGQTGGAILDATNSAIIKGSARKDMSDAAGTWADSSVASGGSVTATLGGV